MRRYFQRLSELFVTPATSVRDAMAKIDAGASGIVLVIGDDGRLIATITDGDIRRALLDFVALDQSISEILVYKTSPPITAAAGCSPSVLLEKMTELAIQQLPLLDEAGRVVDLALLKDLKLERQPSLQALIMAGGFGKRLMPLTRDCPKPMLPVGGRPLLELTVERLNAAGIQRVNVATHYLWEKIVSHFGDGSDYGVQMRYLQEDEPLGTGGALGLLGKIECTTLVINGDIVTDLDFRAMANFHREHRAALTLAVVEYNVEIPYGVVEHEGVVVQCLVEKPTLRNLINAGIYLIEPMVAKYLSPNVALNMTDLIDRLIADGELVVVFPVREYWTDVGQRDDYERVQRDIAEGRIRPPNGS